jgi:nicotinamidase/pyrazinamidase
VPTEEEVPGANLPPSRPAIHALLVVDVQRDFCEGGSLAVEGGNAVAAMIAEYLASPAASQYAFIVATRDHHVDPGSHFSAQPDYVDSWPPHCVAGTPGAAIHPAIDVSGFDEVFLKGEHAAAYSGFEGVSSGSAEPRARLVDTAVASEAGLPLADWLRARGVTAVDIAGIATDYCVRATAADAVRAGFGVRVMIDLTAGVSAGGTAAAVQEMLARGVEVIGGGPRP